jgi:uncharacterized membrane protein
MLLLTTTVADFDGRFGHHGHRPLRILLFVLFLALVVAVVWLIVREVRHRRMQPVAAVGPGVSSGLPQPDAALEQLRMRYARSEITRDEYLQMVQDLGGAPPT